MLKAGENAGPSLSAAPASEPHTQAAAHRPPGSRAATPQVNGAETGSVCLLNNINFALRHSRRKAASPFYLDALPISETGYQWSQT